MTRPNGHSDNGNAGFMQEPDGNEILDSVPIPPLSTLPPCRSLRPEPSRERSSRSNRTDS